MRTEAARSRRTSIVVNRICTCVIVVLSLAMFAWQPIGVVALAAVVIARTYLHFLAGVMGHEAAHGHMGNSKRANLWWGRLALIPTTVPYITFRKTHLQHHAFTNIPEKDPDEFLNTSHKWEIPFRALLMPHHWLLWLEKHNRFTRRDWLEYALTYAAYGTIYGTIAAIVGLQQMLVLLLLPAILHSWILWYFFAIRTHEGYSTGAAETRSHDYYGHILYWMTLGLSLHRQHHLKPSLAWLQMRDAVLPASWKQMLRMQRDICPARKIAA